MDAKGFTLIELLVVIAIIGILAAAAIPQITGAICDANGSTAEQAIASMKTAFTQCTVDRSAGECNNVVASVYNDYLSQDAIDHLNVTVGGSQLTNVRYIGVGCSYNAGADAPGSPTNKIAWTASNGVIKNL